MALQFASLNDLQADLAGKPGIHAVDKIVNTIADLDGFSRHDIAVIARVIDPDGTERYVTKTQQIVEDLSDNTFGYGSNRQWDLDDKSGQGFQDKLASHADGFVGAAVGGATVVGVNIEGGSLNEVLQVGVIIGYMDDNSTIRAMFKLEQDDTWTIQLLT